MSTRSRARPWFQGFRDELAEINVRIDGLLELDLVWRHPVLGVLCANDFGFERAPKCEHRYRRARSDLFGFDNLECQHCGEPFDIFRAGSAIAVARPFSVDEVVEGYRRMWAAVGWAPSALRVNKDNRTFLEQEAARAAGLSSLPQPQTGPLHFMGIPVRVDDTLRSNEYRFETARYARMTEQVNLVPVQELAAAQRRGSHRFQAFGDAGRADVCVHCYRGARDHRIVARNVSPHERGIGFDLHDLHPADRAAIDRTAAIDAGKCPPIKDGACVKCGRAPHACACPAIPSRT